METTLPKTCAPGSKKNSDKSQDEKSSETSSVYSSFEEIEPESEIEISKIPQAKVRAEPVFKYEYNGVVIYDSAARMFWYYLN